MSNFISAEVVKDLKWPVDAMATFGQAPFGFCRKCKFPFARHLQCDRCKS